MESFEILEVRPGRCIATWRNVVLLFGPTSLNTAEVKRLDTILQEAAAAHAEGVAVLRWVPAGSPGPTEQVRQQVITMFASFGDTLRGYATVLEAGSGFWTSGARGVLLDIASRSSFTAPLVVMDDLDEATVWLTQRFTPPLDLSALRMAVARTKTEVAVQGSV